MGTIPLTTTPSASSLSRLLKATVPGPDQSWVPDLLSLILGIIAAVIATVVGALLYDRLKRRVRVVFHHCNKPREIDEIHSLYLQRVADRDRVSPLYITNCLDRPRLCFKSARHFLSLAKRDALPRVVHILATARCEGKAVGLLKALYVRSAKLLFIAYVAVQADDQYLYRRALQRLLSDLQSVAGPDGPVDWVAYELVGSDPIRASAPGSPRSVQTSQVCALGGKGKDLEATKRASTPEMEPSDGGSW